MVVSRFNKEEADVQRDYMLGKLRKTRLTAFGVEIAIMAGLFAVLLVLLSPFRTDPLYLPLVPSALAFFIFGAVFLGTGAYFKKKAYAMADPEERGNYRARFVRTGLVWMIVFSIVLVIFLPMAPFIPQDPNYAESMMSREGNTSIAPGNFIRVQFSGADPLGTYRAEATVKVVNNVNLDFYLISKADSDTLGNNLTNFTGITSNIANSIGAIEFSYKGRELYSGDYVVLVLNNQADSASIHYVIFNRTSDDLALLFVLFFLIYIGMVAGWIMTARKLGVPAVTPDAGPVPQPLPASAPARPPADYRPGVPERGGPPGPIPAAQYGGTVMPITCPKCGTAFSVEKGSGQTRIRCPGCGKEGTLGGSPAPMPAPAPAPYTGPQAPGTVPPPGQAPAPVYDAPAPVMAPSPVTPPAQVAPSVVPAPAPAIAEMRTIACPRCKQPFQVEKKEGPQQIRCPGCGKEGTIGKKPAGAQPGNAPLPAPAVAPAAPPAPAVPALPPAMMTPPATPQTPAPAGQVAAGPKTIGCPACKKPFTVTDTKRPVQVKCPSCGKTGMLKK